MRRPRRFFIDFIYEPPHQGFEDFVQLMHDPNDEEHVDAITDRIYLYVANCTLR
jgi:hypothetical protein